MARGKAGADAPWRDEATLRQKYLDEGKTQYEMADELGCSVGTVSKWMARYEIPTTHPKYSDIILPYRTMTKGYEIVGSTVSGYVLVHQLLAIAEGYDPHRVFSPDWDVHHLTNIGWDNRPESITLVPHDDHPVWTPE